MEKKTSQFNFDFVGTAHIFGAVSVLLMVASLAFLAIRGLSYGIDFAGGTEMQVKFAGPVEIDQLRAVAEKQELPGLSIQGFGSEHEYLVRFQTKEGKTEKETNDNQNAMVAGLRTAIDKDFGAQQPEYRRVDSVGPQVGNELKRASLLAVFYSLLVILIYVALRFDYKFAPGAVICLFHDAVITLAIFVLVGKEVNIPILAAILTLIGFSLNDTIVVFDRIRETMGEARNEGTGKVINRAINDMLSRTLVTSGTTMVSSLALWIFADGTVSDIAFAITVGMIFGTYSSVYVAAPFILVMEKLGAKSPTPVRA